MKCRPLTKSPDTRCYTLSSLYSTLTTLIDRLDSEPMYGTEVIQWSCPVPSFGDPTQAYVATLGINPSNREFLDGGGEELQGQQRRLHTLTSLGIASWSEADARHLDLVIQTSRSYFARNPYSNWFSKLNFVISGLNASYYDSPGTACHIDLVPYATAKKWSELSRRQQSYLLNVAQDILGVILRDSPIRILILNGSSVVKRFESVADCRLDSEMMPSWALNREKGPNVPGVAFKGSIDKFGGVYLDRSVSVIGFNHNLQGSFGVSSGVLNSIKDWVVETAEREKW